MTRRIRRGMLIKNLGPEPITIRMKSRKLSLEAGDEAGLTPEEVRDPVLRDHLQIRSVAIVRPTTEEEDETLKRELAQQAQTS